MSAVILLVCLFLLAACAQNSPVSAPAIAGELRCPDCPTLQVSEVVDGDTFDSPKGRIRLFGVDTPERGEQCYREATERLRELAGEVVRVEPGPRAADVYDRFLYYVYTEGGESIDATLIKEGFGVAWTWDGQYRDYLVQVETAARRQSGGCLR